MAVDEEKVQTCAAHRCINENYGRIADQKQRIQRELILYICSLCAEDDMLEEGSSESEAEPEPPIKEEKKRGDRKRERSRERRTRHRSRSHELKRRRSGLPPPFRECSVSWPVSFWASRMRS